MFKYILKIIYEWWGHFGLTIAKRVIKRRITNKFEFECFTCSVKCETFEVGFYFISYNVKKFEI